MLVPDDSTAPRLGGWANLATTRVSAGFPVECSGARDDGPDSAHDRQDWNGRRHDFLLIRRHSHQGLVAIALGTPMIRGQDRHHGSMPYLAWRYG
ncbi:hypothetical protein CCHR01_12544 [Colletotrichum chrysophilum]|uniref:Uncharacterized protein n=1 Tax=Colletotrichum chrysophilum TaxID=1836956 RepID=A0AAD9EE16_9PEZI|nr:hypothetical protein K456DRAFT_47005 [Colletotrichum gloeosporioides 23]KAK1844803.1 hypothetical protein CCHR01_12544 [Colletotrichum chrysophilum]